MSQNVSKCHKICHKMSQGVTPISWNNVMRCNASYDEFWLVFTAILVGYDSRCCEKYFSHTYREFSKSRCHENYVFPWEKQFSQSYNRRCDIIFGLVRLPGRSRRAPDRRTGTRIVCFSPLVWKFSSVRELLFSQVREKTNILAEPRITFLRRELLLEKSTKNSLNFWQTRITLRNAILVGFVRESVILV